MKGYITLRTMSHENNVRELAIDCNLENVTRPDKLQLVKAVMHAVKFDSLDIFALLLELRMNNGEVKIGNCMTKSVEKNYGSADELNANFGKPENSEIFRGEKHE